MQKRNIICGIFLLTALTTILHINSYRNTVVLTTQSYEVNTNLSEPLRIIHLSDLHGHQFGKENQNLVNLVAQQTPDLILMTGDMLDKSDENANVICDLIEQLHNVAPVYYGYGNHEKDWEVKNETCLRLALETSGAVVLDTEFMDVEVNGQLLRLGGYHSYYRQPGMFPVSPQQRQEELDFAENFEQTDCYKILLNHIPTAWLDWHYIDCFPVDLVLTGHYHGGQIRLPFIGGLYAPYVGLFPKYTEGMYQGAQATCILSRGLGSSPGIPRILNPPQIVVVDLLSN